MFTKIKVMKEGTKQIIRTICYFVAVVLSLIVGYIIGKQVEKESNKPKPINPYSKIYNLNDISIAVDESNNLLLLQRKTGDYIIYSDSVGNCIFRMYANKIYEQINNSKNEDK